MTWASETARALRETFQGTMEPGCALGVVAIDGGTVAIGVHPDEARSGLFDIGSITKTMTATILASLVVDGSVALDDPIGRWLDAGPNGEITLLELATHTSGLPRLAPNWSDWPGFDVADPYAGYTAEMAEEGLRAAEITGRGKSAYSNFGFQLLGLCLCRATGVRHPDLIRARVFEPAGMATAIVRGEPSRSSALPGHSGGREVPPWRAQLPGPGGVLTSVDDMAAWLRAHLDPPSALAEAIALTTRVHYEGDPRPRGLGWSFRDGGLVSHAGGTAGHRATCAIHRSSRRAAAVLATSGDVGDEQDHAVIAALRGEDPRAHRPAPLGPEWTEYALELAGFIATGAIAELHAKIVDGWRRELPIERFEAAVKPHLEAMGRYLSAGDPDVGRRGPGVRIVVPMRFENGELILDATANSAREIIGMTLEPAL